ncbi:hypothetical protein [Streptomyces scopuliridis]|uniref:Uncharacterized protein n=1 Tax=Streptomyces scopuliridis RB72 TaxID=1440053 RepID=A0A2T7T4E5_9ACTN|nr:hypothetical protein [Streptomyces scopuliridis]PVE10050.1 hypothetical protein Y717_01345 [Streptomyces scopuliridis RB72]
MSQSVPPPGNPFADGAVPPGPYTPPPPPAPVRDNLALGLVTALVAALVAGGVYGGIAGAIEREIGWAAIGVGFLVGFAAGKVGGPNPVLPIASAVLSLGAVYLGQLLGIAISVAKELNVSATDVFLDNFGLLTEAWNEGKDIMTFLFFALAAFAAFSGAKKAAE